MKSIERLSGSRVSPSGMEKYDPRLIHEIAGAAEVSWKKIRTLPRKLPKTATTEISALAFRNGRVARMMVNAAPSGRRRTIHGRMELIARPPA
jgi:hypothetical protein